MAELQNKIAVVTGAGGGIGRSLVQAFAAAGAKVVMADVQDCNSDLLSESCVSIPVDVSDENAVKNLVANTIEQFGGLDILVNNAAVLTPTAPVENTSLQEFEKLVSVNLRGTFLLCKHAFPHLRDVRGCVLNISSMAGIHGEKHHAIYAATKGAINALTQSMAVDWGEHGIRCNALCPSSVLTPNVDAIIEQLPNAKEIIELRCGINALNYTATPQQIADVAIFLCSPHASFMTGAIVPVSGGSECGYGIKY